MKLAIDVQCGEKTCATEPGKFCQYVGSRRFGTQPVCLLFPGNNAAHTDLFPIEDTGWLRRCAPCLAAEKAAEVAG